MQIAPQLYDTLVIGGGVTGLAVGQVLARRGESVCLLERQPRLGGAVITERRDGFLCEAGPNSMLVKSAAVWDFLESLQLGKERVEANPAASKRYLVKRGRMVPLPMSPVSAITTPLYSPLEKLRLLAEPFIRKSRLEDESVTAFVSRRMGPAFLEYGISALVSGIYAGNPDALSIRHAFGKVWNLEQKYGSLIGGSLKLKRERRREGISPFKSRMISFKDGLVTLVEALSSHPGLTCLNSVDLQSLQRDPEGNWTLELRFSYGPQTVSGKRLVLAVPLDSLRELPLAGELGAGIRSLPALEHPPLSTLVLGFRREDVGHPLDGFGVLCPRREKRFALGCIFSSTLFPGRAPAGCVSLMAFIGGVQQPQNGRLPTAELVRETVRDLRPLLDLRGEPVFHSHTFWPRAIPQYNVGHGAFLAELEALEKAFPGLYLEGNFRGGPGLNDCLERGLAFRESGASPV